MNSFLLYRFAKVVAVEETAAEVLEVDGTSSIHIIGQNVKKKKKQRIEPIRSHTAAPRHVQC